MAFESFVITIDGQEADDLYADVVRLEVETDDEMAAMTRLSLAVSLGRDGSWTHLDDERLVAWSRIDIAAGFDEELDHVFSGYITHLRPHFEADSSQCALDIWAMDTSVLMDRHEKLREWPNKKDSDIVSEILLSYGFAARVDDTAVVHDEAVSTILQRETDMQFLKRLAARNGFQCYVDGDTGYFEAPNLADEPQPTLAAHFGNETTLTFFSIEVNALSPTRVSMAQLDRTGKEILEASADEGRYPPLGRTGSDGLLPPGMAPGQTHASAGITTGRPEMARLCEGVFDQAEWFVTGEGQVAANLYGRVLRPRRTVVIKGVGETYSGVYYVSHVTHSFSSEGYTQSFRVKRNALQVTGAEDFNNGGRLLA